MENNHQPNKPFLKKIFMISLVGFVFSITLFQISFDRIPNDPRAAASVFPVIHSGPLRTGFPINIIIPSIGINAPMQYVRVEDDGAMTAPNGPTSVGWLDLGARPGEIGTAVVAGHSGYDRGIAGAFDTLHKLKIGEIIQVRDDQGVIIEFKVRDIKNYDPNADASEVFRSRDSKSHLNLITCNGSWDDVLKTHTKRLVVFADRLD